MLYLIATPIGNLQDITLRALDTLKSCDYILCEDTRHSLKLLSHFGIKKTLKSYHEHNESYRAATVVADLKAGMAIALISDAGTPGISDPGTALVQACREEGLEVQPLPGACAAIAALSASGLGTARFQFMGFFPRKAGELQAALQEALSYAGTTIFYESPKRLAGTLQKIHELAPARRLAIAKELTKTFEGHFSGTASELLAHFNDVPPKGEFVVMLSGAHAEDSAWEDLDPMEHVQQLEKSYQLSRQEAIKLAAKLRGVPKRDIYNLFHGA